MVRSFLTSLLGLLLIASGTAAQNLVTQRELRMGVVLPLKEKSARGAKMVEFYQGMLMAVDSLKREGISVDIQALHSGTTASEMDMLLNSQALNDCDIVFGPLDAAQLPALADYCDLHDMHLVVPFTTLTTQLKNHPRQYLVSAPRYRVQEEALWYIQSQFSDYNIILVETNESNEEGTALEEQLRKNLSKDASNLRVLNIEGDDMAFLQAFNPNRKNLLVPNSSSLKALNKLVTKLKDFQHDHEHYEFALFGYPAWQTYTQQLLSDFYQMNTYVYTSFYRNPLSRRSEAIDRQFMQWFHTPMNATYPRYALMGFDLGYYFLHGLSLFGRKQLSESLNLVPANPYQHPLFFENTHEGDGHINTFVELIHYAPDQSIELINRNR